MKIAFKRYDWEEEEENGQAVLSGLEWEMCKGDLKLQVRAATLDMWVRPTFGYRDGDVMVVEAHNRFAYEWLTVRLRGMIERVVAHICGGDVGVRVEEAP